MKRDTSVTVTRRQTLAVLAISEAELKAKDNKSLHPIKGSDGGWLYNADEVGFVARGGDSTANTPPTGVVCGAAFELFVAGKSLTEVVIALKQSPATVWALRNEYDAMARCLTLSTATVSLIEHASRTTVRDEQQLLGLIDSLRCERDAAYQQGRADASNWGEVLDPGTGKMRAVNPKAVVLDRLKQTPEPTSTAGSEGRGKPSNS